MYLEDFNYSLPKNLIAKRPTDRRESKILICSKKKIINFKNIFNELDKDDVLIFNNTKVLPSVIEGICNDNEVKFTLLKKCVFKLSLLYLALPDSIKKVP